MKISRFFLAIAVTSAASAWAATQQDATNSASTAPAPTTDNAAPAPAREGSVARAQFTSGVQEREPTDKLTNLSSDKTQIYFFTELKNLDGTVVIHRWEHDGKVIAEQPFEVDSPRWRVWSRKTLNPSWTGEVKVSVVDGSGKMLTAQTLKFDAATAPAASTPASQQTPSAPQPDKTN